MTALRLEPVSVHQEYERRGLIERGLPFLLMGYVFLDRGFAWLHVPGTPLFVTEIVLATGLVAAIRGVSRPLVWKNSTTVFLLVAFAVWGLIRTFPHLFADVESAFRDSANWFYVVAAFVLLDILIRKPDTLARWLGGYKRLVVPIVIVVPVVAFLADLVDGPTLPDGDVSVFSYKPGNAAVHVFLALALIWAVWRPDTRREIRWRYVVTAVGVAGILALSTQGRGGFVAVAVAGALLLLFASERSRLVMAVSGSLIAIALTFAILDPRLDIGGREVSVDQFASNVSSIVTGEGEGELGGNVDWRLEHWTRIWNGVNGDAPLTGHGFGVNLAELYGIPQADLGLRNAHNSHLTVLARMGWVGAVLWIALWGFWFFETGKTWSRYRVLGLDHLSGLSAWAMVGVAAIHVNAFFDPTLEGPQVGMWLWTLAGLGMFLAVLSRIRRLGLGGQSPSIRLENSIQQAFAARRPPARETTRR